MKLIAHTCFYVEQIQNYLIKLNSNRSLTFSGNVQNISVKI